MLNRFQRVVKRVGSPGKLPGAEVVLPALFVEIRKDEEYKQGNNSRNQNHACCNVVHRGILKLAVA